MDNLNELRSIWLSANTDSLPAAEEMVRMVKKFRNQKLKKKWMIIIFCILMIIFWIFIAIELPTTMFSTRVGEVLPVAALIILITTNLRSLRRFYELNDSSNKDFIAFLEQTRNNQLYYYKKTQVACMILSFLGLMFYMYEFVHKNTVLFIVTYICITIYMLVMWFVVRPRMFKKQSTKMQEMMDRLQGIAKQL